MIRSSILRGSRMNVGSTTLLRSAPGLSWDMMWDRTASTSVPLFLPMPMGSTAGGRTISLIGLNHQGIVFERVRCFAGGSTAWIKDD